MSEMIARLKSWQRQYRIQIGYNPANLICKTASAIGYKIRLWPTREQAEQWATENGFTLEGDAQ